MSYRWEPTDAGRSESKRPKSKNDCTVRAVAKIMDMTFDDAYDYLAKEAGRKAHKGFNFGSWAHDPKKSFDWIAFQAVKGQPRMTCIQFCDKYPSGRWFLKMAHHVAAVIDGTLYDTTQNSGRCVYGAWRVK